MTFPTPEFFTFFTLVLILNWLLKRWPLIWRLFLLISSYFFYSLWSIHFLVFLIYLSLINFFIALAIGKNIFGEKKFILATSIIFNLSVLGLFKYYDFFRVSAENFFREFGLYFSLPILKIILPIGLSFYIFRIISYNIDVYLGKISATSSLLDFAIYVAFFPQLLSGPIMRAGDFLPQLKNGGSRKIENLYWNLSLIFWACLKNWLFPAILFYI